MGRPCLYDKDKAIQLAFNGFTNRQIADHLHTNPTSIGQMLWKNGITKSMRDSQAVCIKIQKQIWAPLAAEAGRRGIFPSTFICNILRTILADNLLNAILDENPQDIAKNVLTSPHICGIIHPTSSRKASA